MRCLCWLLPVCAVATACIHDDLVQCGNTVCPRGRQCDVDRSICIEENGLSVPPAVVGFDALACGAQDMQTLEVRSFADHAISFTAVSTVPEISVAPASGVFPASGAVSLQIIGQAPSIAVPGSAIAGSVLIATSEGVIERPVQLAPYGAVLAASVHQLDFGESTIGVATQMQPVTFTNSGNADVSLALMLTETPASDPTSFMFQSAAMLDVAAGATASAQISFDPLGPNSPYMYSSNLGVAITGTMCAPPPDPITTTGAATMDDVTVDHLTLDFGTQPCNQPGVGQMIKLTNHLATAQTLTSTLVGDPLFTAVVPASVAGSGSTQVSVTRGSIPGNESLGTKTAMLQITASGPPMVTKNIALTDLVKAPVVTVDQANFDVTMTKNSVMGISLHFTNSGTDIANLSVAPPMVTLMGTHITLPSTVQIQPGATVPVVMSIVAGGQPFITACIEFVFTDPNACSYPIVVVLNLEVM